MATPGKWPMGDKQAAPYRTRQPSRWLRNLILLVIVAALAILGWRWNSLREEALVGAAYGARVGCVCRYVSQRPLKSCEGDLKMAGLGRVAGLVSLSDDPETKTVRAGVPLLAHQSATFDEKTGCQLEPWDE
ncbi:hypothetical protein [Novosphingobium naphthalenivorans]|uniref:hypothetical protein n=1 Tax=Novosphingobium naphthalenivorans TaxID=273168 RepID=UPI000AD4AAA5|nr:hypothetical protein [Novosphingobium naphthalenivorans]